MRTGLFLTAALALVAPPAAAADPPVVYQTQPVGRVLDEARAAVNSMGGERAVKEFNAGIRQKLGEKGFDGLDLNRPLVGYVVVPADAKKSVAVVAIPVSGEKAFLDFCERWNKSKPKALKDGLYEVPPPGPETKAVMRVVDGYAYVATAASDPAAALDPKVLIPAGKLFDPTDTALMTGRVYFDRFPQELRDKAAEQLEEAKKGLAAFPFPADVGTAATKAYEQFAKLGTRYLDLSKGAKEAVARVRLDPDTGDAFAEASLVAVPGSPLDQLIAARKPSVNAFAGLVTPDAVGGFRLKLPLFDAEVREAATVGLEALRDQVKNNAPAQPKPLLDELLKGLIRTVKAGDVDLAGVLRGPSKDGTFTSVVALTFDDPSGVEKEAKKLIDAQLPPDFKDLLKWDAAKAGGVNVHTFEFTSLPGLGQQEMKLFGATGKVAFAFAPKAIYFAVGPDDEAAAAIKAALAQKPAEAPVFDILLNPARIGKLAGIVDPQGAANAAKAIGTDDKLLSAVSLSIAGGKELTVKYGMNVKLFGRGTWIYNTAGSDSVPPGVELKK